ncbi:hypothetical protein NSERUTF1_3747 [Nocardia seriolae]|nr:hypothetical protein NSERUTF1_3747 [Nocardia seriolae]
MLARFLQGVHQFGVANRERIDARFQFPCAIRRVGELPPECSGLGAYCLEFPPGRRVRMFDGAHDAAPPSPGLSTLPGSNRSRFPTWFRRDHI